MLRLRGFWKTPEGVKEFEKIGQPYGNTIMDNEYEDWLRKTKDSPKNETKKIYVAMERVKIADGKEYIVYSELVERRDKIGNHPTRFRSPLGIHPKPIPNYVMTKVQDLEEEEGIFMSVKKMDGYSKIEKVYDIPLFSKEGR